MELPSFRVETITEMTKRQRNEDLVQKAKIMPSRLRNGKQVCKLQKALYGLRQAGRQLHAELDMTLKSIGLTPLESDPCTYVETKSKVPTHIIVYVDDMLIASKDVT